ncbi:MAG: ATP synthase F0 subunit C [Clostridiales bacterium]|nr:ATP synthase F0 subunit C [Clostridiales bacterium]
MENVALAAAIAVLSGLGAGVGIALATGKATEAISRQPEAANKINSIFLIGAAMAEATAIYGFVIAILILFAT